MSVDELEEGQEVRSKQKVIQYVGWTLLGVGSVVALVISIYMLSINVYVRSLARDEIIRMEAIASIQETRPEIIDNIIRIETGATVMTKVWFAKDMKEPIILQMLVTSGVCKTSKEANEQAMAQIKKPASAIYITCKKVDELNQ